MTQEQLLKHLQFCKSRWNGYGEDVFQEACLIALQRYQSFSNVNQNLFGLICKEAARKLLRYKKYEIPFSQLLSQLHEEENFINSIADPRSLEPSLEDELELELEPEHKLELEFKTLPFIDKPVQLNLPLTP